MIIVVGTGFTGSNAMVKLLMDMGIFMGDTFMRVNPKAHPYPTYEDLEWHRPNETEFRSLMKQRIETYGLLWGFKAGSPWMNYESLRSEAARHCVAGSNGHSMPVSPIFIAGTRDDETLMSRMKERWGYNETSIRLSLGTYRSLLTILRPLLKYGQQTLLHNRPKVQANVNKFLRIHNRLPEALIDESASETQSGSRVPDRGRLQSRPKVNEELVVSDTG